MFLKFKDPIQYIKVIYLTPNFNRKYKKYQRKLLLLGIILRDAIMIVRIYMVFILKTFFLCEYELGSKRRELVDEFW